MNHNDLPLMLEPSTESEDLLGPLLRGPATPRAEAQPGGMPGVVVGELLALAEGGTVPLVRFVGQPGAAALRARSTVDLQGRHIGQSVLLVFEQADATRPIVIGVLREQAGWPLDEAPAQVQVDADGARMIVSAKDELVLRCGKASITLTKVGKVLIEGSYLLSKSSGVNRVKGGSVQLN